MSTRLSWIWCLGLLGLVCESSARGQQNWPAFRGSDARGVADEARLPDRWSATQNVAWKVDVPGRGWSSPIVWGNRIYLTTCIDSGAPPEARKGLYFGGEQKKAPQREHLWQVVCLDLQTGATVWTRTVHQGVPQTPLHVKNTYASETPVTDGKFVYAYFGNLGVYCLDLEGKVVWSRTMEPHRTQMDWGPAASPALADGRLYIVNDNQDDSYLLALDGTTGDEIWRVKRDEQSNWSTPFIWKTGERTEIVTAGTRKFRSYSPDGKVLWELAGTSPITIATPYESDGLLYISSGYVLAPKKPIYAIRPGAEGNLTLSDKQKSSKHVAWVQRTAAPYNPTTLVYRDRMYVLYDRGLMACLNAKTGDIIYDKKRLGATEFTASPWANNGKVYCLSESGETYVIPAGDKFEIEHTNTLEEDDMCMATPAVADNRLLVRTLNRLYCIRQAD